MRENLIGYLLGALSATETEEVEQSLESNPGLRDELNTLAPALTPLKALEEDVAVPAGLASRTTQWIAQQRVARAPAAPVFSVPSRWAAADIIVAASVLVALSMLFVPALNQSIHLARLSRCQDRLRQLGTALTQYSETRDGFFPVIQTTGPLSVAGMYAPALFEQRLVQDPGTLICPGSPQAEQPMMQQMPTAAEIQQAQATRLAQLRKQIGGSYAYNIGYVQNGDYHATKNMHRTRYALLADAPADGAHQGKQSTHHVGRGQNVLMEDGHVVLLLSGVDEVNQDHIYLNEMGEVEVGLHLHDAVLASSDVTPVLPVLAEK
jgi:hypothetical protein